MIRVLLADDHVVLREGLRGLLSREPDIEVVGEAGDGLSAITEAQRLNPDVVVMDIAMPEMNGVEASRRLLASRPGIKVVILSMHADSRYVRETLEAGASGYLLKQCAVDEVVDALRAVDRGLVYLSPSISGAVVEHFRGDEQTASGERTPLTAREREVLQLLAEGSTTRVVANKLHISPKTVETHRAHVMTKLGLDSLAELTKYAIRTGLTSLDR